MSCLRSEQQKSRVFIICGEVSFIHVLLKDAAGGFQAVQSKIANQVYKTP
jgi:hypothetical protein